MTRPIVRAVAATASAVALLGAAMVWAVHPPAAGIAPETAGGDGVREIAVRVHAWGLNPAVIRVARGQRVRFVVATDDVMHGFAINELGLNLALGPGRTSRSPDVEVALADGIYPIHCSVFCGLGHGAMKGRLVVGSPPPDPKRMAPWIVSGLGVLLAAALVGAGAGRRRPR